MRTTLGEICVQDRKIVSPGSSDAVNLPYLGLEQVESQTGRILNQAPPVEAETGVGAAFRFDSRHVLYSKLRPYLNKVALPDHEGRCSTEMIPLLPAAGVNRDFLALLLRSPAAVAHASSANTGARMPRADMAHLFSWKLALPDLPTQRRLVSRLKAQMAAVEQARQGIEAMCQLFDELVACWITEGIQALDTRMQPVDEVLEEVTKGIGSAWTEFPVLGATRSGVAPAKEKVGKAPGRYKPVRPGSVFYNPMRIMIGSIAMLDTGDAAGITSPDYVVVRPRSEAVHHLWVYEWLRGSHGARFIQTLARGGVRERMLFSRLKAGEIPVPPMPWQLRFAEISRRRRQAVELFAAQLAALDQLPGAYLREAFGNLQ